MAQQTLAYNLTARDERTADRLINHYELKIDREGDDLRQTILAQLERKLARFQRIGADRLTAIYKLVISEIKEGDIQNIETPTVSATTFTLNVIPYIIQQIYAGSIVKIPWINIASYNGTTQLKTISLYQTQVWSADNIEGIWLEHNGTRVTTISPVKSDNSVTLTFIDGHKNIDSWESKSLNLMVQVKNNVSHQDQQAYLFKTKQDCITTYNSQNNTYNVCKNDSGMQSIGWFAFKTDDSGTKFATYQLFVDGVEKAKSSNLSKSDAGRYCQIAKKTYSDKSIKCIWNGISLYKPEVTKDIYQWYLDEKLFITTEQITKSEALANCLLHSKNNSQLSIRCLWNNKEIYSRKAPTPTVVETPSMVLSNVSPAISTANAQEEIKLLRYSIINSGKKKFHVNTHNVELLLSDTSANKSDFLIKSYVNGELIDTSNDASYISKSFLIDPAKRADIVVSITAPKTYSGTIQFMLKSVSADNYSNEIIQSATLKSSVVTIKPFISSLKMMQVSSVTQPLSVTGGSLWIWKYQTSDDVSPYTSTFNISVNNPSAKKVSIDLYMNGKMVENFVNHTGELNINGWNFWILPRNTSATIEFRQAKNSEIEAKDIKITLMQVEYGDSTGDGKIAK